jgi:hypothetical protein
VEAVAVSQRLLALARDLGGAADSAALEAPLESLRSIRAEAIDGDAERIAFWLNLYNACLLRELSVRPRRGHLIRHRRLFRRAICVIGGETYALDDIEHGVLRGNRRPPASARRRLRTSDPRLAAAPSRLDPRIHFALNCGAVSCPPIRSYDAEGLDRELDRATRAYLAAEATLDRTGKTVVLPGLLRVYGRDFGDRAARIEFAIRHLDPADAEWLRENRASVRVRYARFDWTMLAD